MSALCQWRTCRLVGFYVDLLFDNGRGCERKRRALAGPFVGDRGLGEIAPQRSLHGRTDTRPTDRVDIRHKPG